MEREKPAEKPDVDISMYKNLYISETLNPDPLGTPILKRAPKPPPRPTDLPNTVCIAVLSQGHEVPASQGRSRTSL